MYSIQHNIQLLEYNNTLTEKNVTETLMIDGSVIIYDNLVPLIDKNLVIKLIKMIYGTNPFKKHQLLVLIENLTGLICLSDEQFYNCSLLL